MSEYKRLTKWEMNKGVKCVKYWQYSQEQIAERLALLEDKIENGTLIELPCKVGDTIYEINSCSNKVNETKARHLWDILRWKDDNLFGRWLFTDKAEAEQRLKELKDER